MSRQQMGFPLNAQRFEAAFFLRSTGKLHHSEGTARAGDGNEERAGGDAVFVAEEYHSDTVGKVSRR